MTSASREQLQALAEEMKHAPHNAGGQCPGCVVREFGERLEALLAAQPAQEYPHLPICNGDRHFPAGVPGHSCCCLNISAQDTARLTRAQVELGKPIPATVNGKPGRVAFFTKEAAEAYGFEVAGTIRSQGERVAPEEGHNWTDADYIKRMGELAEVKVMVDRLNGEVRRLREALRLHFHFTWPDGSHRCRCGSWAVGAKNDEILVQKLWTDHVIECALAAPTPEEKC